MPAEHAEKKVMIGRFGKPFGLRGHIYLHSFTVPKENIIELSPWQIERDGKYEEAALETIQIHGKNIVVKLAGCDDREAACAFTNLNIFIERSQLPEAKEDEYYWTDLEGLKVINQENTELGFVEYLFATPANDIMVVKNRNPQKLREYLIPFIKDVILKVDLKSKLISVDWEA